MNTSITSEEFHKIKKKLDAEDITLVAVSKKQADDSILFLYNLGQRIFGENRVQELIEKKERLPEDIEWHLIGHLQRNKVKYIAPFISLIHSIDSAKLLKEVNKQGERNNRVIPCLLQFHIADEESKFGLNYGTACDILEKEYEKLSHVKIHGVMGMATFTDNKEQVSEEFSKLAEIFNSLKEKYFIDDDEFKLRSMGMSGDYEIAIQEGSNMVRIGSAIFGPRKD